MATRDPTPYTSTGASASAAMRYSSRSDVTVMRVEVAPRESSSSRALRASSARSPESILIAPNPRPATSTAVRIPCSMSYVSTSNVVPGPCAETCETNASFSLRCARVNACAAVPTVGMPYASPAARLLVVSNPARYAARAFATAARSCARREPISISGRPCAATAIRAAADAIALSWLSTDSTRVSRIRAWPSSPRTVSTGEPGK